MTGSLQSGPISNRFRPRIGTIIIPTDPYWVQTLEAIFRTNQKIGDDLVMLEPAATLEELLLISPEDLVDQVLAHSLDVLICTVVTDTFLQALLNEGLPVICMAELDFHHPRFTAISNLYPGGVMSGDYIGRKLAGRGHVLCVSAGLDSGPVTGQGRRKGFYDSLKSYPEISIEHIPAYWSYARTYPHLLSVLADYARPIDAIFGVSDTIICAARDAGRRLGVIDDHTVLVGLNGDPMALAAVAEGDLSATVDISSERMGAEAVMLAHRIAYGGAQPAILQHNFQLITRDNVASIATRKLTAISDIPTRMVGYNRQQENDRLSQLRISMEITRQIGSLMDRNQLTQVISHLISSHYGYDWMRILRWSDADHRLVHYEGELSPASKKVSIEQDPLLHQVFLSNEAVLIPDTHTSHRWHAGIEWQEIRSRAVLPIQLGAKVIGVLDLQSNQPVRQASLETVGLKLLASQLGIAIQNADLYLDAVEAREVAERANQLKTRLVANVGHEMRTPLNAVLGFSHSIQKKLEVGQAVPAGELRQDIGHIYRSGEQLMYMINDLLDLSRAEIGALSLYFEALQPVPFLKELFHNFSRPDGASAGIRWVLDIPDRLPVIRADIVRLRQILNNLLSNACKYTSSGTITLGASVQLPYLHFWVKDTGDGVPLEIQEKIFEPFGTASRRRRKEGIGLGLSITRHLVSLHDGIITLESQPGQGSTFNVYLPLPGVAPQAAHPTEAAHASVMLVVTNRPKAPDEILRLCESQKLVPRVVSTREQIKGVLAEGVPAAIAWDMEYTSSNEWALIYQISGHPTCTALPFILYGNGDNGGQLAAGLTSVIFKPNNGNAIRDWLGQVESQIQKGLPILVVDDDPQARAYYEALLLAQNPESRVILAENGAQALDLLANETPALILLDLVMPEVDGFAVLESVRRDLRTQHVPVVVISGKLLDYEDIQRLNYFKTIFYTKGILSSEETGALLSQMGVEGRQLPQPTSQLIKKGLAFLHQNYAHPISRKDIAESAGVSENYFSQIFRQEMTISPWDYLNRLRIQKAKALLLSGPDSVTKIALAVGFNDSAYFSRVFHKLTGQSPQEFRQSGI